MSVLTASNGHCAITGEFRLVWDEVRETVRDDWFAPCTVTGCRVEVLLDDEWVPVDEHPDYRPVPGGEGDDVCVGLDDAVAPVAWEDEAPFITVENELLMRWGLELEDIPVVTPW
ncbi:MAG: hypothetical protein Q4D96_09350 [Propionibacteriaceae bacterium]|nr:hypothetical protein [Propionibacteriaceae bacterium]